MPDEGNQGWLWWRAIETFGEAKALAALRAAGATDSRIEAYRAAVEAPKTREIPTKLSYAEMSLGLLGLSGSWLMEWGAEASLEDLEYAARRFLRAESPEEQIQHLRIFAKRAFPLDLNVLVKLTASKDEALAYAAVVALAQIKHPEVRDIAFQLVARQRAGRRLAIVMIGENFEPNDHELVLRWFESEPDRYIRHGMGIDLRNFWEDHPEATLELRMLRTVYEQGECSDCREWIVRGLLRIGALSVAMRQECAHDANEGVRALVGATSTSGIA